MFRLFRVLLPYGIVLLLIWGVVSLPDPVRVGDAVIIPEYGLDSLPDAQLTASAGKEWGASRHDVALVLLSGVIEQDLPGSQQAAPLMEAYRQELRSATSPAQRLLGALGGDASTQVNEFTRLADRSVADAFLFDDPLADAAPGAEDILQQRLAEIGQAPALFPQGEAAAKLLAALERSAALSATMRQSLLHQVAPLKTLPDVQRMKGLRRLLLPFWEMAQQCRSFARLTVLTRLCDDVQQVRILATLLALAPGNDAKLAQSAAVASLESERLAKETMAFVIKQGQEGLDALHAVFRKGAAGAVFAMEHPSLTIRLAAAHSPGESDSALGMAQERWASLVMQSPGMAHWAKLTVLGLCILLLLGVAGMHLRESAFVQSHGGANGSLGRQLLGMLLGCGVLVLLALLIFGGMQDGGALLDSGGQAVSASGTAAAGDVGGLNVSSPWKWGLILMTMLFSVAIQLWLFSITRAKLRSIMQGGLTPRLKLYMLDNLDLYFDLPMYVGLGFTIFSFLLITISGAESARYVAYLTTLIGICNAVSMRISLLQPARSSLFDGAQQTPGGPGAFSPGEQPQQGMGGRG